MEKRQKATTEQQVKVQREAPEPSCISSNVSTTTLGLAYNTTVTSKLKEKKKIRRLKFILETTFGTPVVVRH